LAKLEAKFQQKNEETIIEETEVVETIQKNEPKPITKQPRRRRNTNLNSDKNEPKNDKEEGHTNEGFEQDEETKEVNITGRQKRQQRQKRRLNKDKKGKIQFIQQFKHST
jgi:hypothetical protein